VTVSVFLNEDLRDDQQPLQSITMTHTSLNARLISLGAEPVSSGFFQDLRQSEHPSVSTASMIASGLTNQEPTSRAGLVVSVDEAGARSVIPKPRIINPEDDAELGPA
jgi:hypothetical protein